MARAKDTATEIRSEHEEIAVLADRIAALPHGAERTALVHEACARFVIHAEAEQRYLYPAVRRFVPIGDLLAADQAGRDRAVARTVASVECAAPRGEKFDDLVDRLLAGLRDHGARQDTVVLPALIEVCPAEELDRLGGRLRDGLRAARAAAVRAGARACEQAEGGRRTVAPAGGEDRGFRVLLRRIASAEIRGAAPC